MIAALNRFSSKADSETWRALQGVNWCWNQCMKSHHVSRKWSTSVALLVSSHSWTRDNNRYVLTGLRRKRTVPLLCGHWSAVFSSESKFYTWFGNQGHRCWRNREAAQNSSCLKLRVKFSRVGDWLGYFRWRHGVCRPHKAANFGDGQYCNFIPYLWSSFNY